MASRQCSDLHLPGSRGGVWLGVRCDATCQGRDLVLSHRRELFHIFKLRCRAAALRTSPRRPCHKAPAAKFPEGQSS